MQAGADPGDSGSLPGLAVRYLKKRPPSFRELFSDCPSTCLRAPHAPHRVLFSSSYFSPSQILVYLLITCSLPKAWTCLFCSVVSPCLVWCLVQSRHLIHIWNEGKKSSFRCALWLQPQPPRMVSFFIFIFGFPARGRVVRCRWVASGQPMLSGQRTVVYRYGPR